MTDDTAIHLVLNYIVKKIGNNLAQAESISCSIAFHRRLASTIASVNKWGMFRERYGHFSKESLVSSVILSIKFVLYCMFALHEYKMLSIAVSFEHYFQLEFKCYIKLELKCNIKMQFVQNWIDVNFLLLQWWFYCYRLQTIYY